MYYSDEWRMYTEQCFAMKSVSNLRKTILNMSITLLIYSMCQLFCKSIWSVFPLRPSRAVSSINRPTAGRQVDNA